MGRHTIADALVTGGQDQVQGVRSLGIVQPWVGRQRRLHSCLQQGLGLSGCELGSSHFAGLGGGLLYQLLIDLAANGGGLLAVTFVQGFCVFLLFCVNVGVVGCCCRSGGRGRSCWLLRCRAQALNLGFGRFQFVQCLLALFVDFVESGLGDAYRALAALAVCTIFAFGLGVVPGWRIATVATCAAAIGCSRLGLGWLWVQVVAHVGLFFGGSAAAICPAIFRRLHVAAIGLQAALEFTNVHGCFSSG